VEGAPVAVASVLEHHAAVPRWLDIMSVVLLSVAALASAWCTYQAALWDGLQAEQYTIVGERNVDAALASAKAGQQQMVDLGMFMNWLSAYADGKTDVTTFYERRFRADFVPAFRAWVASEPRRNRAAPPTPFVLPEYRLAERERANQLTADATRAFGEGRAANQRGDDYVLDTVVLASVLFLAGIAQQAPRLAMRKAITAVALVILVGAVARIATSPLAP